jgi:hypothetical protein
VRVSRLKHGRPSGVLGISIINLENRHKASSGMEDTQDTDIKTTTLRELGFSSHISVALIRHRAIVHDESSDLSFDRLTDWWHWVDPLI